MTCHCSGLDESTGNRSNGGRPSCANFTVIPSCPGFCKVSEADWQLEWLETLVTARHQTSRKIHGQILGLPFWISDVQSPIKAISKPIKQHCFPWSFTCLLKLLMYIGLSGCHHSGDPGQTTLNRMLKRNSNFPGRNMSGSNLFEKCSKGPNNCGKISPCSPSEAWSFPSPTLAHTQNLLPSAASSACCT